MERNDIFNKLKDIFKLVINHDANVDLITEDHRLIGDLGVSSVGLIYLMISIEETFGVDMSEFNTTSFMTVKEVIDFIEQNIK